MISSVRGSVLSVAGTSTVIEVGGIGLSLTITPAHASQLRVSTEATVRTALVVKEDDLSLFGFVDTDQLRVFDLLRGVTGVGPKSAMGVLSVMTPDEIASAVNDEDDAAFRKVSGIGPKTAKLIVVSLAGKMVSPSSARVSTGTVVRSDVRGSVVEALIGLGWNERAAAKAADDAQSAGDPTRTDDVQALLRSALGALGPSQAPSRSDAG